MAKVLPKTNVRGQSTDQLEHPFCVILCQFGGWLISDRTEKRGGITAIAVTTIIGTEKRGSLQKGSFHWRNLYKISKFSKISRKWSDSPFVLQTPFSEPGISLISELQTHNRIPTAPFEYGQMTQIKHTQICSLTPG